MESLGIKTKAEAGSVVTLCHSLRSEVSIDSLLTQKPIGVQDRLIETKEKR